MKSFSELSQDVWTTTSVSQKKEFLMQMVNNFKYKGKFNENVGRFTREVERCNSGNQMIMLGINCLLYHEFNL